MVRKIVVRKNRYFDSVFLMQVARRIAAQAGISDASAVLATEANRKSLTKIGYGGDADFDTAGPNDLVIAVSGDERAVDEVLTNIEPFFSRATPIGGEQPELRSIAKAVAARPDASVAVISVPGEYAAREARAALEQGLNVFLFSSNVAVEDELALKTDARRRGLIVMGPDCGTAFLGGAGVGFANAVRRGPIGIVASTGTGMQEFASLIHRAGSGISNGIGTGSRDLSEAIGGISMLTAIDALEDDPATKVIAVLSKPPAPQVARVVEERLARCRKPTVLCLLGSSCNPATIDEAAALALRAVGVSLSEPSRRVDEMIARALDKLLPEQRYIRGVFAGGTLCYQAQVIFRDAGIEVHSNEPLPGMAKLANPDESLEHSFVDMGVEHFVDGRPHPMIDATLRRERVEREGADRSVAIILLDFVLGAIASNDPAGDLLPSIRNVQQQSPIVFVASVCGTDTDTQNLAAQTRALEDAGVLVFPSAAEAAAFCLDVARRLAQRKEPVHAGKA